MTTVQNVCFFNDFCDLIYLYLVLPPYFFYICWIPQNLPSSNLHNMVWSLVHRKASPAAGGGKQYTQSI